jgi:hypothetical protein
MFYFNSAAVPPAEGLALPPSSPTQGLLTKPQVLARNHVRIIGHGKPPLLVCNGIGYTQRMWHTLATVLAHDY